MGDAERAVPGGLGDQDEQSRRRGEVFAAHVEPLNRWVDGVRSRLPAGAEVPRFDPVDGGVGARLLWLGREPSVEDLYSSGGTGFVSLDGTGDRSRNLHAAACEAGVDRSQLLVWNAYPCNMRELRKAGGDKDAEVPAPELLGEMLGLLPELQVVVLAGRAAWEVFQHLAGTSELVVISTTDVRDTPLEARPREREALVEVWTEAVTAAAPPESLDLVPFTSQLPEIADGDVDESTSMMLVQLVGDRELVAFGSESDLAALGRVGDPVPSVMVQSVRSAAAALPAAAEMATSGHVVWLTKESAKMLRKGRLVDGGNGSFLGVVRNRTSGQWMGQLRFKDIGATGAKAGAMATALPTLLSAVAMQQQMAAIEKRLAAVQESLDELIEDRRIELEAGLDTNLEILGEVAERTRRRGELEESQWQRLATVEPRVRDFQKRTRSALSQLNAALDPDRSATARTKELASLVRNDGLARQLVQLVKAEVALARWQGLQLLHDAQEHPEELGERTEQFMVATRERHHELVVLARRLDAYLGAGTGGGLMDRAKSIAGRKDAAALRSGLADVLDAYRGQMELLGLEAPPPPPAMAELSVGDQIGDSVSALRHRLGRRKG